MIRMKAICIATISVAAAGCADHGDSVFQHLSVLDDTHIAVHAHAGADAIVTARGELVIDGKPVPLNSAQSKIVALYFASAIALRSDAVKTGAAGAATAATAIASVASGLASGDTDSIDAKVNASAAKVDAAANKVCTDLQALQKAQDDLAAALPQFKPYATIAAHEVDDCTSA
ncbi:MAG: hypothetical protein JSR27_01535 [Proteobacteria bacterium]|nr:hypothetical protein [Pseudomonadota bacterium]